MNCLDPATISIALVEDDRRIREGLRVLLEGTAGFCCINAWRSMEEALAHHWNPIPTVALIDIGLPGVSGIEGLRLLRERYPAVALVMLTVFDDDERIFNALCAGASGYLLKGTSPIRLLESIREVVAGRAYVTRNRAAGRKLIPDGPAPPSLRLQPYAARVAHPEAPGGWAQL